MINNKAMLNSASTKGILLDIDNTLYSYEPTHQLAQSRLFDKVQEDFSVERSKIAAAYQLAKQDVKNRLGHTAASHNRLLYLQRMCEILDIDSLQTSLTLYETYWGSFLDTMELTTGAISLLAKVAGTPLCLLTDLTAHIQHRKVAKLQLHRWADFMVSSEEAGHEKPHPSMFHLALSKLDLDATEVCMIGDNYAKDIQGAARLGIHACWLNTDGTATPDDFDTHLMTEIADLAEITWVT